MKRVTAILIGVGLSFSMAWAQKPRPREKEDTTVPHPVHFMVAIGNESRPEKNVNGDYESHTLTNYSLGTGYESFVFILEKATFTESSGNATLSLERTLEDYLLWTQYRALSWNYLAPFLGLGAGVYRETVKTKFLNATQTDQTPHRFLTGLSFGVALDVPVVWLSLEGRVLFGDELERQPTLGGLVRAGLQF